MKDKEEQQGDTSAEPRATKTPKPKKMPKSKPGTRRSSKRKKGAAPGPYPEALVTLMMSGWREPSPREVQPIAAAEAHRARRQALSERFEGEALVIPTGHEVVRANDTHYAFRPGSDFFYLTGNTEPDCVLVLEPRKKGGHRHVLFVEPNPGRSDSTFFTDRHKGELWVGPRLGIEESRERFAVDECRPLAELDAFLKARPKKKTRAVRGLSARVDAHFKPGRARDGELASALSELRLIKEPGEIAELERAVAHTLVAFEDVIVALRDGRTERDVEVAFDARARRCGNGTGYGTIAAAGKNACILHYTKNDEPLVQGELLLLDAGVEGLSLYTADVTRTLPIDGKFSPAQREIYEIVSAAQFAAFEAVRPGAPFLAPHEAAQRVLAEGLARLGILSNLDDALAPDHQFQKRYTLHGTSHMLGLDVHDCAAARPEHYRMGELRAGHVLTIEPGLYFQPDDLTVPERYRGIGIRIEDDVLVTDDGCRLLSQAIPRKADEVEAWIARVWSRS